MGIVYNREINIQWILLRVEENGDVKYEKTYFVALLAALIGCQKASGKKED